jgi:hypothetical protein
MRSCAHGRAPMPPDAGAPDRAGPGAGRRAGCLAAQRARRTDRHARHQQPHRSRLDRLHRQRRRHRLPGRTLHRRHLHELRADRHPHHHQLQQYGTNGIDDLPLPGPRPGCSRQSQRLLRHRLGHHTCRRHHRAEHAHRPHRRGGEQHADQPELERLHRQRRRHRLSDLPLPGHDLHDLQPGRNQRHDQLQQHRARRRYRLPLSRPRRGCDRQPEHQLQHRHRHHAGG